MSQQLPSTETLDLLFQGAMGAETDAVAKTYLARLVEAVVECKAISVEVARKEILETLGYLAGYGSHETRLRIERLYGAEHPYLGTAEGGPVSPEMAIAVGQRVAQQKLQ